MRGLSAWSLVCHCSNTMINAADTVLLFFFRAVFVHGFAVDAEGHKMSKSQGNVVDPLRITHGGADKKREPVYGIDTLRYRIVPTVIHLVLPYSHLLKCFSILY
jgi:Valyl-tRNA synthetase